MKVFINKFGKRYLHKEGDLHTTEGTIKKEDMQDEASFLVTNKRLPLAVCPAQTSDLFLKLKRGPQIILEKDIGYVIAKCKLTKNSVVVEAGGGSGAVTCTVAPLVKHVHTFEVKKDHCKIISRNMKYLSIDNVTLYEKGVEGFDVGEEVDLLFLDLPNPDAVLESEFKGLKRGAYIVCYVPTVNQLEQLQQAITGSSTFIIEEVSEILQREWYVQSHRIRPHNQMLAHTAFLCFIRYLK